MRWKLLFVLIVAVILLMVQSVFAEDRPPVDMRRNDDVLVSDLLHAIPEDQFGGIYYNQDGNLVLRIKDTGVSVASELHDCDLSSVIIEYSEHSLAELEPMKASDEPYMIEYGMISVDANEATGTIDIVMSQENDDIIEFISSSCNIDPDILYVTVTENRLCFTTSSEPAGDIPGE